MLRRPPDGDPSSTFVAGFVGTSNLLEGEAATSVLGRTGVFSIRPEKIHLGDEVGDGDATAPGVVQDVVYLGSVNHYLVELDAGPTLTVLRQNLRGTTNEAMSLRGQRVTVGWAPEHVIELGQHEQQQQQQHREKEES